MSLFFRRQPEPAKDAPTPASAIIPVMDGIAAAATHYGERVGGDLYDFVKVGSRLVFGLLDVAGRTADNASIAAAVQDVFRASIPELFAEPSCTNEADAMMELTVRINRRVLEAAGGVHPCSAFAACCNAELGTLCYVNAGHSPGLLRTDSTVSRLEATGLPLGLFSHATHDAPTFGLPPGGALLLVSRGLVEAASQNEEFGLNRVELSLLATENRSASQVCDAVVSSLVTFLGRDTPQNDISAVAVVRGSAASR